MERSLEGENGLPDIWLKLGVSGNKWRRCSLLRLAVAFAVTTVLLLPNAHAQSEDLNALLQRFLQRYETGQYAEAVDLGKRLVQLTCKGFGPGHTICASMLGNLANAHQAQGQYREAEKLHKRALAILEKALGPQHPDVASAVNNLANAYWYQDRISEAEEFYARALAVREMALGPEHPQVMETLHNLANAHRAQGRYPEAEKLLDRALAGLEKLLGPDHPTVARTLSNLALVREAQGHTSEAEKLYARALSIREKVLGPEHPDVARTLGHIAGVHQARGRYAEAEKLYARALAVYEKALGPEHPDVAGSLHNLAVVHRAQGRYPEAERFFARALANYEKALGPEHSHVATTLSNLAGLYGMQGLYGVAEKLFARALTIREKVLGSYHSDVGQTLSDLALTHWKQGHLVEAEGLYARSLAIQEKVLGSEHTAVAWTLHNLALAHRGQGRYADAERLHTRALSILEKALGPEHPDVAQSLSGLAMAQQVQGRYTDAERLHTRALSILEKALGSEHPEVAEVLRYLGLLEKARGRWSEAYAFFVRAAGIRRDHTGTAAPELDSSGEGPNEGRYVFWDLAEASWHVAKEQPARGAELRGEAFAAAQWAARTSTAKALSQMVARLASSGAGLGFVVREVQDLQTVWIDANKRLIEAIGAPGGKRNEAVVDGLRTEIKGTEERLATLHARLSSDFPAYAELSRPMPLDLADVQAQLSPDEALIFYLAASEHILVWGVTREGVSWQRIELGAEALGNKIAVLRQGLDCRAAKQLSEGVCTPWQLPFNLELAQELYEMLLGPVADLIREKQHLFVVLSGTLTSLPLHVLVTEKPPAAVPEHYAGYRDPAWLMKRHALTVLPSVSSLKALRVFAKESRADKPFVGFGDAVFSTPTASWPQRVASARGFASYFKGRLADRDALGSLDPLPETALELKAIASTLGVPESEIYLKERATESVVKGMNLERYRIVHFATHGLVAGDLQGLAEPALALTVPAEPSEFDDGLLTASEVAQLKLNADWVILSACNTAAGDKPGAEALSGLVRAFFYAGARALLVSHWPVESDAAVKLTIRTFAELKANPGFGRAQALQQAMLALMADRDVRYAHPALWAPFMVVGEGGAGAPRLISGPTLQRGGSLREPQ